MPSPENRYQFIPEGVERPLNFPNLKREGYLLPIPALKSADHDSRIKELEDRLDEMQKRIEDIEERREPTYEEQEATFNMLQAKVIEEFKKRGLQ